jgi:hypothetical protein
MNQEEPHCPEQDAAADNHHAAEPDGQVTAKQRNVRL